MEHKLLIKKAIPIQAVKWDGNLDTFQFIKEEWGGDVSVDMDLTLLIKTLEGEMACKLGDWVVRGVRGELYPIKEDILAESYDDAGETKEYSGRILVRLPKNLHKTLAEKAKEEGVSLNTLIVSILSGGVSLS